MRHLRPRGAGSTTGGVNMEQSENGSKLMAHSLVGNRGKTEHAWERAEIKVKKLKWMKKELASIFYPIFRF